MKSKLVILSLLGMTLAADAAKIVWVSDNGDERATVDGNSVDGAFHAAVSAGTPYVDQGFVDLLIAAGHEVTRYNPDPQGFQDSAADIPLLNGFDLIILGSALNSGPFNLNARSPRWNTLISKPMIVTKSTLIRRDRMGWLLDNKEYDCAANTSTAATGKLTLVAPANPIFAGIATTTVGADKVMTNFCNVIVPAPEYNRGTSVQFFSLAISGTDQGIANAMEPGGTLLASIHFNPMDPGVNIPAGQAPAADPIQVAEGYAVAEWPAGTTVRTTQAADTLAGYRLFFGCGTRDASGAANSAPNPQAGALDLSADGQQIFRNAVVHALGQPTLPNHWTNASSDSSWNDVSENWNLPAVWAGGDAFFGATGAGTVNITAPVTAHHVEVTGAEYNFVSADPLNELTLAGTNPGITANAKVSMAATLSGTDGLTVQGTSTLTLEAANTYTGGTFVKGGTLVLRAPTTGNNSSPYAVDGIDALDTGATVRFFNDIDLTVPETPANVRVPNGQIYRNSRLVLTGGTYDLAGDDNQNQMPAPSGTGRITNSSPYARAVLKMGAPGGSVATFSGIISDGGPLIESVVSGKQGYRMDIDLAMMGDDAATFVIAGVNTYTGFTRIGSGKLTFTGNGRWGVPTSTGVALTSSPNGTVICNGNSSQLRVDFNGTSQTAGGLSGNGGVFANNAEGTLSTLTVGAANISNSVWPTGGSGQNGKITDNTTGNGGITALTKTGTGTIGLPTAQNDYSGPTLINDGILEFTATGAPSPNSDHQINSPGQLRLGYEGTKNVNGLFINGVKQPAGEYSAITHPDFITGDGTITVAQVHPTYPSALTITRAGNNPVLSWTGVGLLQASTDLDTWTGLPSVSPYVVNSAALPRVYYRIKQ